MNQAFEKQGEKSQEDKIQKQNKNFKEAENKMSKYPRKAFTERIINLEEEFQTQENVQFNGNGTQCSAIENKKQQKGQEKSILKQTRANQDSQSGKENLENGQQEVDKYTQKKGVNNEIKGQGTKQTQVLSKSSSVIQNEVIIKGINFKADEESIKKFLEEVYGEVIRVNLLKSEDGKSKGLAFITFASEEIANKAVEGSNIQFMERYIIVEKTKLNGDKFAQSLLQQQINDDTTTIFIGNLYFKTEAETLKKFFSSCGTIVDARIAQKDGQSRGFGHVEFSDKSGVEKALTKQGECIDGRNIKVDIATQRKKSNRGGNEGFNGNRGGNNNFNKVAPIESQRNDYSNERKGIITGFSGQIKQL